MRGLSKREKILIYIAVLLLIIYAGGILLVIPALGKEQDAQRLLKELLMEEIRVEQELLHLEHLEKTCERMYESFVESQKEYEAISSNSNLEQSVLTCMNRKGLAVISTSIVRNERSVEEQEVELSFQEGSIEVKASGSMEECMNILKCINQNPIWSLTEYSLYTEEYKKDEMILSLKLDYGIPGITRKIYELEEEGQY